MLDTYGIMQSIGIKEFVPYLKLDEDGRQGKQGQAHLNKAIELLKTRTRRLCKSQRNWHKHRLVRKAERGQVGHSPPYYQVN